MALLGAIISVVVVGAVELTLPLLFGKGIVDEVLVEGRHLTRLTYLAGAGIVLILVKGVFTYGRIYLMSYVGQKVVVELRRDLFRHLTELPMSFHSTRKTGDTISRVTNDIGVIQNTIASGVTEILQQSLLLTGITALVFFLNWQLALVSLVSIPLAALTIAAYGRRIRDYSTRLQEKLADLTAILGETLNGIRVVKAFTMERQLRKGFDLENERSFHASMKSVQAMATVTPVVELVLVTGIMVVVWFGGRAVLAGEFTMGALISFLAYLGMATRPLGLLTKSYSLLQQAIAAADRIFETLDQPNRFAEKDDAKDLESVSGRVEFRDVSFAYEDGIPVLRDINLAVEPGEVVALVGPSGAGKTSLMNLIPRFYDPTEGTVLLDGTDVRDIGLRSLRKSIGLVPQDPVLFSVTIAENIAASTETFDMEDVVRAAKMANAHDFIEQLAHGYETVVGERGATLSGGQRQRIAIARAIFRNPKLLLLDEATSALDVESEAVIQDALSRVQENRTSLIIAHRLSTIYSADKIVVLDQGRIVETGTHHELLVHGHVYPRLYQRQFQNGAQEAEPATVPGAPS